MGRGPLFLFRKSFKERDQKFKQWQECLDKIYSEIQGLLINRYIFLEVQKIIKSNPKIQIGSAFYDWIGIIYPAAMVMGVRRQLDTRSDSISLARLLADIEKNPEILSRKRYLSLYEGSALPIEVPEKEFDGLAGSGAPHIDPKNVLEDLRNMEDKASKIRKFANKRIAHFGKSSFQDFPTFGDLDECLDLLEELLKKYMLLLRAQGGDILPSFLYDWKKIFRYPWIELRGTNQ